MAAGLRVHVTRPRVGFAGHSEIIPLVERNPERLPPPEIADDLPTPIGLGGKREPLIIDPMPPASQFRVMWSFTQLLRYLLGTLALKYTGRLTPDVHAVRTRQLFERLSGIWIKVGQLLSLRSDLISNALTRELAGLQYQARGFPPDVALRVVEEELGRPITTVFAHFERTPFAAASIAQVHRATLLHNNRAVVVKVMRPDVGRSFARDLKLLESIVHWMSVFGVGRRLRLREGLVEMRAVLSEETDYQYEAVNLKRMRKNLKDHEIYVPRVIKGLSARRILVMEEVPGVLMSQYLRLREHDPRAARHWAILNGIDEKTVARRLSITVLRQILEDNEFHGDLHPGNIMLLADNNIALIDFGSVGRLTQHTWQLYRFSMQALAMRDYNRAADLMLMMSPTIANANNKRLRHDMTEALRGWELSTEFSSGTYADRSMAAMSNKVAQVMAEHRVPLSWGIMRVGRSLSTLDASLQTLVPKANFMSLARAYFRDRQQRMRTLKGRRAAFRSAMTQMSSLASDVQLLIGTGIRDQALRLHGMLDRLTNVRILLLTFLQRGLMLGVLLVAVGGIVDEGLRPLITDGHQHFVSRPVILFLLRAVPDLHPIWWVLLVLAGLYLFRVACSVRQSIVRLE